MTTKQATLKQSSAKLVNSTKPTGTATQPIDDILSLINGDDNEKSAEVLMKLKALRFLLVNRFTELIKDLITDDTKFIQIYFDEVPDNTKFDPQSKSKYVMRDTTGKYIYRMCDETVYECASSITFKSSKYLIVNAISDSYIEGGLISIYGDAPFDSSRWVYLIRDNEGIVPGQEYIVAKDWIGTISYHTFESGEITFFIIRSAQFWWVSGMIEDILLPISEDTIESPDDMFDNLKIPIDRRDEVWFLLDGSMVIPRDAFDTTVLDTSTLIYFGIKEEDLDSFTIKKEEYHDDPDPDPEDPDDGGLSAGAIAGIVVGSVSGVAAIVTLIIVVYIKFW